jgi:CBS domain containing-hemolysin-like protein
VLVVLTLLAAAGGILLFSATASWPLSLLVVGLALGLDFFWQPRVRLTAPEARFAAFCAPGLAWLMSKGQRFLDPVTARLSRRYVSRRHTGVFERADLLDWLDRQAHQRDNRIPAAELQRLKTTLELEEVSVKEVMVPRKHVAAVDATAEISPIVVDELHKTGHRYFPVYQDSTSDIVGILALDQIADVRQQGQIGNSAANNLVFVHERDQLVHVLRAFYETGQYLFIVVDGKSNYSGIITLKDVLRRLTGALDEHAFGRYDDREAVAARHGGKKITEVVE